ncbi:MAG: radical SAM protein [Bryobacteraceae bacterium]|nr:radical SAM protein [Bryobacteraceae bacterium]
MGSIVVELTNRCNLSCQHCFSGRHGGSAVLPLDVLRKILDEARPLGFTKLGFTGGDPTLHPEFRTAIRMTAEAGYRYGVVTNGWTFPAIYTIFQEHRMELSGITFSLDGGSEGTHDSIRGTGSFRKVLRAFSICVVTDLPFTVNMVLNSRNVDEAERVARMSARLGAGAVRFGHLMPTPLAADMKLDLTPVQRREAERRIRELNAASPIPLVLAPGYHAADLFPCGPLRGDDVNVDCHGNLTKCCHLSGQEEGGGQEDVAGSLHEVSFAEAWRRLVEENARVREEKERRQREGLLLDSDYFPCWYCSLYYRKVDWLRGHPDHPWAGLMWEDAAPAAPFVPLSQLLRNAEPRI